MRPLDETLTLARALGRAKGITRVSEVTRLDRVGVPVYAAIRPGAAEGSLCVHAGKGLTALEACVGAWMEGIEYAAAEGAAPPSPSTMLLDPRALPAAGAGLGDLPDFAPLVDASLDDVATMPYVETRALDDGSPYLLPAELVFHPFATTEPPRSVFGTSTNGLASGNDIDEATAHALAEILERDRLSYDCIEPASSWLDPASLPQGLAQIVDRAARARCPIAVRVLDASSGRCPIVVTACVFDDDMDPDPLWAFVGSGCHASREIAVARALTEALQSRLTFIHGARDDLLARVRSLATIAASERRSAAEAMRARWFAQEPTRAFGDLPTREGATIADCARFTARRSEAVPPTAWCSRRRPIRLLSCAWSFVVPSRSAPASRGWGAASRRWPRARRHGERDRDADDRVHRTDRRSSEGQARGAP